MGMRVSRPEDIRTFLCSGNNRVEQPETRLSEMDTAEQVGYALP